jgi:hypothetical protein
MEPLHLDAIFETAKQIEKFLLESPSRLAVHVLELVAEDIVDTIAKEVSDGDNPEATA